MCYLMARSLVSFPLPGCQLNCLYPYKQLCLLEIISQHPEQVFSQLQG